MAKHHILVFPYPAQGHMLPLLDLTHHLALQNITITIVITPKNLPTLNSLLTTHPNTIQTLILPFPPHPKIPSGVENIREIGNTGNYPFINALSNLQEPIIQWFKSHRNPPVALISDFFLGWTQQLASQLSIPRIVFYICRAFLPIVVNNSWGITNEVVEFSGIFKTQSFKRDHLPSLIKRYRESDPESEFVKESFIANGESWGSIFITFKAFEGPYLDQFRVEFNHQKVFAIGPLTSTRVEDHPVGGPDLLKWLDQWEEEGSVLFVCFGSQKFLKREQMEALALGLEKSMTRFVWVVKEALTIDQLKEGYGVVPDGFEERVSGRGIVVRGWVSQVGILGHRVVGGFLSHCGWNSVLEAVVAGVGIVAWPMEADQFVNARLLVEDMGVAVKVCEGADLVPDPDELGRVIKGFMSGDSLEKKRAKLLREEAVGAVSKGGVSSLEFDQLVQALKELGVGDTDA